MLKPYVVVITYPYTLATYAVSAENEDAAKELAWVEHVRRQNLSEEQLNWSPRREYYVTEIDTSSPSAVWVYEDSC